MSTTTSLRCLHPASVLHSSKVEVSKLTCQKFIRMDLVLSIKCIYFGMKVQFSSGVFFLFGGGSPSKY